MKKDFISIRNLSSLEMHELIVLASAIKAKPAEYAEALTGQALAMIFEKPSLRTRVTFDVGIHQLGGFSVYLAPGEIGLGSRETVYDIARNLERMVQGVLMRTFSHQVVEQMAACARIPVINGLTDYSHPCQALADYMTIREIKGDLRSLKIAFVGDGNNVAHSLIFGAVRLGAHLAMATPSGYEPDAAVIQWAREHAGESGCRLEFTSNAGVAVSGADVVYTDVWASMGREAETNLRHKVFQPYQVNEQLLGRAHADAIFMHCLPAHRGEEVTEDILLSPQSVVYMQAENRLYSQKAILLSLMGSEERL